MDKSSTAPIIRVLARILNLGAQIVNCNYFGSQGGLQYLYTQITTMNMHYFIEIRHNILIQCLWSYMEVEEFIYMGEIDIL